MVELFVNNVLVDLSEELTVSLNFSMSDIRNPDKRNASYSKTITLPGTTTNNRLFSNIYDTSVFLTNTDFNPNKKVSALLFQDSELILEGSLRLLKVVNLNDAIQYEVCLYSSIADLFKEMGEDELGTLDFESELHNWTLDKIEDSWTWGADNEKYFYPMADYGTKTSLNSWFVEDFKPAIQFKAIWDKIFEKYGFDYNSNFINSDVFKKLYLLSSNSNPVLTDAIIDNTKVEAEYSLSMGSFPPLQWTRFSPPETKDDRGFYNNGLFVTSFKGRFRFDITLPFTLTRSDTSAKEGVNFRVGLKINAPVGTTTYNTLGLSSAYYIDIGASSASFSETFSIIADIDALGATLPSYINMAYNAFKIQSAGGTVDAQPSLLLSVGLAEMVITPLSQQPVEGALIDIAQYLPKMKCKDFIKSVIQMFNLYFDAKNRLISIEPRDDYYASGIKKDWTDKLDRSQPIETVPCGDLFFKEFNFKYTTDNDYLNAEYLKNNNEDYASRTIQIDTDFSKDTNTIQPAFSPTLITDAQNTGRVIPSINKNDANGNVVEYKGFKPRVVYHGGKSASAPYKLNDSSSTTFKSEYPLASMVDNPFAPTVSMEFGAPLVVYYLATSYTNNNLVNKYYSKMIANISSPSSLVLTGKFYLTPSDISQLKFNNTIQIDGVDFKINKITDYDPVNIGLCSVELIKDVYVDDFEESTIDPPIIINPTPQVFDIMDGGLNEIQNLFFTPYYQIVDGGEDEVRNPAATDNIFIIYG